MAPLLLTVEERWGSMRYLLRQAKSHAEGMALCYPTATQICPQILHFGSILIVLWSRSAMCIVFLVVIASYCPLFPDGTLSLLIAGLPGSHCDSMFSIYIQAALHELRPGDLF